MPPVWLAPLNAPGDRRKRSRQVSEQNQYVLPSRLTRTPSASSRTAIPQTGSVSMPAAPERSPRFDLVGRRIRKRPHIPKEGAKVVSAFRAICPAHHPARINQDKGCAVDDRVLGPCRSLRGTNAE